MTLLHKECLTTDLIALPTGTAITTGTLLLGNDAQYHAAVDTSATVVGLVNLTAAQQLGANDKKINTVDIGLGGGSVASNTRVGLNALRDNTTGSSNVAVGINALRNNTTGFNNTAIGVNALPNNLTGTNNTASGLNSLLANTSGFSNTAIGSNALLSNTTGGNNVAIGVSSLRTNISGDDNVAMGVSALRLNTTGFNNLACGSGALAANTSGTNNIALGTSALVACTTGGSNIACGSSALAANTTGITNVAVGFNAAASNTVGSRITAVGLFAAQFNSSGLDNTAVGANVFNSNTTGSQNTAIGSAALNTNVTFDNTSGLGFNAQVTGSDQVQLGNSSTTTYVYGTVQNRSDLRDKADVAPSSLGLDFINTLEPIQWRWDYRDDYKPAYPADEIEAAPENGDRKTQTKTQIRDAWIQSCQMENLVPDGTHARSRLHYGLAAQQVKTVLDVSGIDFGGFQDHSVGGGQAVMSLGYDEFIGPMIKAIKEQQALIVALTARIQALELI